MRPRNEGHFLYRNSWRGGLKALSRQSPFPALKQGPFYFFKQVPCFMRYTVRTGPGCLYMMELIKRSHQWARIATFPLYYNSVPYVAVVSQYMSCWAMCIIILMFTVKTSLSQDPKQVTPWPASEQRPGWTKYRFNVSAVSERYCHEVSSAVLADETCERGAHCIRVFICRRRQAGTSVMSAAITS